jgi:hypothetical protein
MRSSIFRWHRIVWQWANKHDIISGFFVTMLGVWAAFWLTGLGEQRSLDSRTKQRLHIVVLESQYNGTTAKKIMDACADSVIILERPDAAATLAALDDANILTFLPHHKVSLLRSYANAITVLNEALRAYQTALENAEYRQTPAEARIRENVRSNAAAMLANVVVLQEELDPYFDKTTYDHEVMQRLEERVKYIKAKVLRGEVPLSKEK